MLILTLTLLLLLGWVQTLPTDDLVDGRNAALEFRNMIAAVTGRSAFDYLGYGCHCGLGGKGKPVDQVDFCCQVHDQCYADTSTYLQFWKLCSPHLITYSWSYANGVVSCTGAQDNCGYKTCLCDKFAAECFARNTFNPQYISYSQSRCS